MATEVLEKKGLQNPLKWLAKRLGPALEEHPAAFAVVLSFVLTLVVEMLNRHSLWGGVVFGVGIGFLTMMIRYFGSYPEGVSFAILIMNSVVPLLNRWFKQKKFGRK